MLRYMAMGAVKMVREELHSEIPITLHLDHGSTYELCKLHSKWLFIGYD